MAFDNLMDSNSPGWIAARRPGWSDIPTSVKGAIEAELGEPVLSATVASGGLTPSAAFRLRLNNDRWIFFKGISSSLHNAYANRALEREERVYREFGTNLKPWAPEFIGSFRKSGWRGILLEDVGGSLGLPWTNEMVRLVAQGYAAFHNQYAASEIPAWIDEDEWQSLVHWWDSPSPRSETLKDLPTQRWLELNIPVLRPVLEPLRRSDLSVTLLHLDTRSDNLNLCGNQLRILDWSSPGIGPAEFDVAVLAQSIAAEGGPLPEVFISSYSQHRLINHNVITASLVALTGYFVSVAWLPPDPAMPSMRERQIRQRDACLAWLARLGVMMKRP
jgi:hypothetical protein